MSDRNGAAEPSGPALSVVIPCFDEEPRLGVTLPEALRFLDAYASSFEVVVVDDGSRDRTAEVAASTGDDRVRLIRLPANRGKGAAVRAGVIAARGDRILVMDADLSTPLEELGRLEEAMEEGADLVIGSRALDRARIRVRQPWFRDRLGRAFNLVIRALGVRGIRDTQCGFKLFSRRAAQRVFPQLVVDRWTFDVELLLVASMCGFRIVELPVEWANAPGTRVHVVRDALGTLYDLLRIRCRWLFRRPS